MSTPKRISLGRSKIFFLGTEGGWVGSIVVESDRCRNVIIPTVSPLSMIDIIFPEEDLALSADKGSAARPGLALKNGCYTIVRKLGRSKYSSTWLVVNSQPSSRCAQSVSSARGTKYKPQGT